MNLRDPDLRQRLADELEAVRRRSLDLLAPLDDDDLSRQHSPLMSPLVWDLAHVGNFEELWLLREAAGTEPIDRALDDVYDAFRHPRPNRPSLPLLSPAESRRYLADVRGRAIDHLERADLDGDRRLLAGGYVYGMVVQHEHQHDETMLATLQLMAGDGYRPLAPPPPPALGRPPSGDVVIPAGPFVMGSDSERWAYDNEGPAHVVDLPAYRIDTGPVSNRRYLEFVLDGGYDEPFFWAAEGWTWRQEHCARHPQFWVDEGSGDWSRVRFGLREDLPRDEPVQHVCWYEADAFARWAGARLPTEAEWEKAASWTAEGQKRRYPWGDEAPAAERANLGGTLYRPAPVGAYPAGVSASGCHQMIGDVWEWTASDFEPYPGFASFPYREYSEVFFGSSSKVLRGGSWATSPLAVRTTFRNWDHPVRRQIFAGFRCARDA
ncbi:MAG TPA: ergothioneine biosynthesis protein EgtB [Acidimicrobiales bacterium]|nr:ergothioneine biosynthesis protein EgtB [Acidimicrobiales bacterium]